jgi:hypothetical protein
VRPVLVRVWNYTEQMFSERAVEYAGAPYMVDSPTGRQPEWISEGHVQLYSCIKWLDWAHSSLGFSSGSRYREDLRMAFGFSSRYCAGDSGVPVSRSWPNVYRHVEFMISPLHQTAAYLGIFFLGWEVTVHVETLRTAWCVLVTGLTIWLVKHRRNLWWAYPLNTRAL